MIPALVVETCETVALPPAPRVAGLPFTWSFDATFVIAVDAVPEVAVPLSVVGKMLAATVTVTVLGAQLAGVFTSHRV